MFTSVGFYLCWGLFALCFCPLALIIPFPEKPVGKIIACIIALVVSFTFAFAECSRDESEIDRWNNGICIACDSGSYEFTSATRYGSQKDFYYTCDNCGHTEKFSHLMK